MIQQQFDTPGSVFLRVSNKAGPVEVHTHDNETTEVEVSAIGEAGSEAEAHTTIEHVETDSGHRVVVEVPGRTGLLRSWTRRGTSILVIVRLPEAASIEIGTASGNLTALGRFGPADVFTAVRRVVAGSGRRRPPGPKRQRLCRDRFGLGPGQHPDRLRRRSLCDRRRGCRDQDRFRGSASRRRRWGSDGANRIRGRICGRPGGRLSGQDRFGRLAGRAVERRPGAARNGHWRC